MDQNKSVFIDTNYFCALYNPKDTLNQKSIIFSKLLKEKKYKAYVSNYIIIETLTIISQRVGKNIALTFWGKINEQLIKIIYMDKRLQCQSFKIFKKIRSKNISFVDASIIALIKKHKIDYLLTFDKKLLSLAKTRGIKGFS